MSVFFTLRRRRRCRLRWGLADQWAPGSLQQLLGASNQPLSSVHTKEEPHTLFRPPVQMSRLGKNRYLRAATLFDNRLVAPKRWTGPGTELPLPRRAGCPLGSPRKALRWSGPDSPPADDSPTRPCNSGLSPPFNSPGWGQSLRLHRWWLLDESSSFGPSTPSGALR